MNIAKIYSNLKVKFYFERVHSKPDFIIIGAAKSGTTSLFHYLATHPQIIPSEYKEPAFFAWHHNKGYDWYLSKFPTKKQKGEKLCFEATPLYLHEQETPKRIKEYLPNCKLIATLRDPVKRAYSHWNFYSNSKYIHETQWRIDNLKDYRSFNNAISDEMDGIYPNPAHAYLSVGYYSDQLKRYFKFFPKDQLLILDFDELKSDIQNTLIKICKFLNVEANFYEGIEYNKTVLEKYIAVAEDSEQKGSGFTIHNANKYEKEIDEGLSKKLAQHFREKNQDLEDLCGIKFSWN